MPSTSPPDGPETERDDKTVDWIGDDKSERKWAIVSTVEGFVLRKIERLSADFAFFVDYDEFADIDKIVSTHTCEVNALVALERAQTLEKQLRPLWQAAIEHAKRVEHMMQTAVWEAAQ